MAEKEEIKKLINDSKEIVKEIKELEEKRKDFFSLPFETEEEKKNLTLLPSDLKDLPLLNEKEIFEYFFNKTSSKLDELVALRQALDWEIYFFEYYQTKGQGELLPTSKQQLIQKIPLAKTIIKEISYLKTNEKIKEKKIELYIKKIEQNQNNYKKWLLNFYSRLIYREYFFFKDNNISEKEKWLDYLICNFFSFLESYGQLEEIRHSFLFKFTIFQVSYCLFVFFSSFDKLNQKIKDLMIAINKEGVLKKNKTTIYTLNKIVSCFEHYENILEEKGNEKNENETANEIYEYLDDVITKKEDEEATEESKQIFQYIKNKIKPKIEKTFYEQQNTISIQNTNSIQNQKTNSAKKIILVIGVFVLVFLAFCTIFLIIKNYKKNLNKKNKKT